jgi:hypothetical protein
VTSDALMGSAPGYQATDDRVELSMPVSPELFALARMLVSLVASRLGFDYEDICDLRLAVDELVSLCTGSRANGARITLWSSHDADMLRIDCAVCPVTPSQTKTTGEVEVIAGLAPVQLSERVLDVLADGHGTRFDAASMTRTGWLWKLRPPA